MTSPDLAKLIERLETATGPDRELDAEIWIALHPDWRDYPRDDSGPEDVAWITPTCGRSYLSLHYTSSIDSALTLVPELLREHAFLQTSTPAKAGFEKDGTFTYFEAPTPALALCIAALKARLQSGGGNG